MCLVLIAFHHHPQYPLIVAANRDEFFERPTLPAQFWEEPPGILAGRDLEKGGTWMGVDRQGRFAAVTNYYEPSLRQPGQLSRGALVSAYLSEQQSPAEYLATVAGNLNRYDGFNLFTADENSLWFIGTTSTQPRALAKGVHGVSNGDLDTPWPKVLKAKSLFTRLLEDCSTVSAAALFDILLDRDAPVDYLADEPGINTPDIPTPVFVNKGEFGTRSSTVLMINRNGDVSLFEKSFDHSGKQQGSVEFEFVLEN